MNIKFELQQKQTLNQQMIQSIEILQMNAQELDAYISEAALENPLIDIESSYGVPDEKTELCKKLEWLSQMDESNRVFYSQEAQEDEVLEAWDRMESRQGDMYQHLKQLLFALHLNAQTRTITEFLIDSLDTRGYLNDPVAEIAKSLKVSEDRCEVCKKLLQSLEPAGIGAGNLVECLILQLERQEEDCTLAKMIVEKYLELLAKNRLAVIAQKTGYTLEEVSKQVERIKKLNPKPGRGLDTGEDISYVLPDVTIVKMEQYYEVLLNEYLYPQISLNSYYSRILKQDCTQETKEYITSKINKAKWIMNCLSQRNQTLLSVTKSLVNRQDVFFSTGKGMKPLKMADVAGDTGLHESTVSRAVKGKYFQCGFGVFPLSSLFSKAVSQTSQDMGGAEVKAVLAALIQSEDRKKPLSDQKISEQLKIKGIIISRRTVAKYRAELGIMDASGRKYL